MRWFISVVFICALFVPSTFAQDAAPTPEADVPPAPIVEITEDVLPEIAAALEEFFTQLQQVPSNNQVVQIAFAIGGILLLFFGWRIYSVIILASGAFIGASLTVGLFGNSGDAALIAALLVGALLGLILAAVLYYLTVGLIGAYTGVVVTTYVASFFALSLPIWALAVAAIVGALLLLALSYELLVLLSSIVGAQLLMLAFGLQPVWGLVLVIIGIVLQIWLTRRFGYDIRRRPSRRRLVSSRV